MKNAYSREVRFYVSSLTVDVYSGKPCYLTQNGTETHDFIEAKHFKSAEAAKEFTKSAWKLKPGGSFIIRSLFVEVNGFDLGVII